MDRNDDIEVFAQQSSQINPPEDMASSDLPKWHEVWQYARDQESRYWSDVAYQRTWLKPFSKVRDGEWPDVTWFSDGTTNITLDCLDRHIAEGRGDHIAYIALTEKGLDRQLTYREFALEVDRLARGMAALGVNRGDRVIIYLPLIWQGIAAMLACARIGAIHSVVYAGLGSSALRTRIVEADAKVVLAADITWRRGKAVALASIVEEAVHDLASPVKTVVLRRDEGKSRWPDWYDWEEWFSQAHPDVAVAEMYAEDPLFILFTSGTTGTPKGAVFVHGGYGVAVPELLKQSTALQSDDVLWCMSDIGWIVGHSIIVYGPLINGITAVIREGAPDFPVDDAVWDTIERYGVTKVYTAPTALRMLRKLGDVHARNHKLDSLKMVVCAGEPLNPEVWRWLHDDIGQGHLVVVDNWWQTETGGPTLGTWPNMPVRMGKAGYPFPGFDAAVVGSDGRPRDPGHGGVLILTRPMPQMFRGVWGSRERYLDYFRAIPGAYLTGDVAVQDEAGYLEILGRSDDVVNVAGHRIGPAEVESAFVSHEAVAEAAAIGIPDALKGEVIVVYVMLRSGWEADDVTATILSAHVRKELGPIATPQAIRFPEKLPKTRSGKIMRRVVKAWELGKDPGDLTTLDE